jgi:predicted transcriptional regulator
MVERWLQMSVKLSVNLPEETVTNLRELAEKRGITLTEALRRAIANEHFLEDEVKSGGKVLVEKPDKTVREIVFR